MRRGIYLQTLQDPTCHLVRCRGRQVASDVAEAVAYLHSLRVVHSDLKSRHDCRCTPSWLACLHRPTADCTDPYLHSCTHSCALPACSNVMLSEDLRACVGDLGSALFLGSATGASAVGFSATHAAPEVMLGERCTLAADVYSLGICIAELAILAPVQKRGSWRLPIAPQECPQVRPRRRANCREWQAGPAWEVGHLLFESYCCAAYVVPRTRLPSCTAQGVVDLIAACTARDPALRPSAAQVVQRLADSDAG